MLPHPLLLRADHQHVEDHEDQQPGQDADEDRGRAVGRCGGALHQKGGVHDVEEVSLVAWKAARRVSRRCLQRKPRPMPERLCQAGPFLNNPLVSAGHGLCVPASEQLGGGDHEHSASINCGNCRRDGDRWAGVGRARADGKNRKITVVNVSSQTLKELYASPITATNWEEDLLGSRTLAAGQASSPTSITAPPNAIMTSKRCWPTARRSKSARSTSARSASSWSATAAAAPNSPPRARLSRRGLYGGAAYSAPLVGA